MKYTNQTGIPLSLAVWLAHDEYREHPENVISATGLLKSTRQILLTQRLEKRDTIDISEKLRLKMGTAIHENIEKAWLSENIKRILIDLNYPEHIANRFTINDPSPSGESFPVYLEYRTEKEIEGMIVSGQFDLVMNGTLEDFKSTGVYSYIKKSNERKYQLQGSIYAWLNPKLITNHVDFKINYIFTNWEAFKSKEEGYPKYPIIQVTIPLLSFAETENFIRNKIREIKHFMDQPEENLPYCTDEELWVDASVWKYYKDPNKTSRSTANFDNPTDAYNRYAQDHCVGIVKEVKGKPKACNLCPAFSICTQKNNYNFGS